MADVHSRVERNVRVPPDEKVEWRDALDDVADATRSFVDDVDDLASKVIEAIDRVNDPRETLESARE